MCLGMGGSARQPVQQELPERNAAPTVSGEQTGVDDPKDTKKATEALMIKRQKEEGRYNPESSNTTTSRILKGGGGNKTAQQKANLAKNKAKAKSLAKARMNKNSSGGRVGGRV
tara:strand:+ start:157 stop:498 length:342 start_codon:yes stop_codon:yes gene_type:complete